MKRPIKVFEPIPKPLIKSLHFEGKRYGFNEADVYGMVKDLTGIPSMTSLSKQEAFFILGKLTRLHSGGWPLPPPLENEVSGGETLPSYYHVREIRLMFSALGWDKKQIKNWLEKYMKVASFRAMDRLQAKKVYFALGKINDRNPDEDEQPGEG
ncbi:MAG: hypothetical protein AB7U29_04180 [Desulfobulbus sp.]